MEALGTWVFPGENNTFIYVSKAPKHLLRNEAEVVAVHPHFRWRGETTNAPHEGLGFVVVASQPQQLPDRAPEMLCYADAPGEGFPLEA